MSYQLIRAFCLYIPPHFNQLLFHAHQNAALLPVLPPQACQELQRWALTSPRSHRLCTVFSVSSCCSRLSREARQCANRFGGNVMLHSNCFLCSHIKIQFLRRGSCLNVLNSLTIHSWFLVQRARVPQPHVIMSHYLSRPKHTQLCCKYNPNA